MSYFLKSILLFLIINNLALFICNAASAVNNKSNYSITVSSETIRLPDSIIVSYFSAPLGGIVGEQRSSIYRQGNFFKFSLSNSSYESRFDLLFFFNGKVIIKQNYIPEQGDDILISIESNVEQFNNINLNYRGKGSEKYKLKDILEDNNRKLIDRNTNRKIFSEYDKDEYGNWAKVISYLDTVYKNRQDYYYNNSVQNKKFKNQVNPEILKLYLYDYNSEDDFLLKIQSFWMRTKSLKKRKKVSDYYFSKIKPIMHNPYQKKYGYLFVLNTGYRIMTEEVFKSGEDGVTLKKRYNVLKAVSNVDLRNRLLGDFFLNPLMQNFLSDISGRDSCVSEAYKIVTNIAIKSALKDQMRLKIGSRLNYFSFYDLTGNTLNLDSLKGQVFMLEFYSLTCGACISFSSTLKNDIYNEFKDDKNFSVVTVNIDRTREDWLKALNSGKFTQTSYINLSTGPLSIKHPIFDYYKINSLPFVILVDENGYILSNNLNIATTNGIILSIRRALKEQNSRSK